MWSHKGRKESVNRSFMDVVKVEMQSVGGTEEDAKEKVEIE